MWKASSWDGNMRKEWFGLIIPPQYCKRADDIKKLREECKWQVPLMDGSN